MPVTAEPKATAIQDTSVENNLGLVHACAHRFKGRGIEYDDLYQAGCMGLVKASAAFDAGRGVMFSTYAVPVILGEIRRLFRDGGTVKVSRSLKELGLAAGRTRELLGSELGREATVNEVAERMGRAPEDVAQALAATTPPLSLTGGGGGWQRADRPAGGGPGGAAERSAFAAAAAFLAGGTGPAADLSAVLSQKDPD